MPPLPSSAALASPYLTPSPSFLGYSPAPPPPQQFAHHSGPLQPYPPPPHTQHAYPPLLSPSTYGYDPYPAYPSYPSPDLSPSSSFYHQPSASAPKSPTPSAPSYPIADVLATMRISDRVDYASAAVAFPSVPPPSTSFLSGKMQMVPYSAAAGGSQHGGVTACVLGDMASRPNFGLNELDFVFSTLVSFVLMYLLAPTAGVSAAASSAVSALPSHMFEAGTYSFGSRVATLVSKGAASCSTPAALRLTPQPPACEAEGTGGRFYMCGRARRSGTSREKLAPVGVIDGDTTAAVTEAGEGEGDTTTASQLLWRACVRRHLTEPSPRICHRRTSPLPAFSSFHGRRTELPTC